LGATDLLIEFLRRWGELNLFGVTALALVFVLSGLVPVPRTALCLASGTIFGLGAVPVIIPSTTLGGILGFVLARYFLAERLQAHIETRPKLRAVLTAIDEEGWRVVGLMRFWGPVPTFSQNYFFGLTRIGLWPFAAATFVFTIPQVALYVYLGALGRAALLDERGSYLSLGLGCLAALTVMAIVLLITRKARAAFRQLPA
jgi:uncharacterized membrane protein YdjX (TVP38/TMEM64 family)